MEEPLSLDIPLLFPPKRLKAYRKISMTRECIREIQDLFYHHFDRNWLLLVLEDLSLDSRIMDDIRSLIIYESPVLYNPQEIKRRVSALEAFISHLRRYLLPILREKLGISGLLPFRPIRDKDQRLLRSLIAYTFPHNLDRLSTLTERLKNYL
jgi:hypothetical protein